MKKKYVIVEVSGGVAYPIAEDGVEVHIIDWDGVNERGGHPTLPAIPNLQKLVEVSRNSSEIIWEPLPGPAEQFTANEQRAILKLADLALTGRINQVPQSYINGDLTASELRDLGTKVNLALGE